ncbi:MAG: hypothetical protein Q9164_003059, partial [Protoblastenia rupestris]
MPSQEPGRSPAIQPQLPDRRSSSQSLSKGSPSAGHLLNTHKGSSTRLHKTHAVGHARRVQNRTPSHGKGLNKLSQVGFANAVDDAGHTKHHTRSDSHSPPTSPSNLSYKRNSSTFNLNRPSSKGSIKRNASHGALSRNGSSTKIGNQSKSEKAQTKANLLKRGTNDGPLRGTAHFEVGDEEQDEEWTEESGSQSPATTRTNSRPKTPVAPVPKEPPTPDEPPERRSPRLPVSPPESPKLDALTSQHSEATPQAKDDHDHRNSYSHPPDAEAVTSRLLNRNGPHIPVPQTTNISANITPQHVGSPKLSHSQASTINELSMPADGISRFLSGTNSASGTGTPGSVSNLHQNLANLERNHYRPSSPADQPMISGAEARRVKSAANLTHKRLSNGEGVSPPKSPQSHQETRKQLRPPPQTKQPYLPSPFESARGANPSAGKSLTQLKLNLDREAASRDPPIATHPLLMNHSSMLNMANSMSANANDMEKRLRRQYSQAKKDVGSCRRYYPDIVTGKIPEKAVRRYQKDLKYKERRGRDKPKKDVGSG